MTNAQAELERIAKRKEKEIRELEARKKGLDVRIDELRAYVAELRKLPVAPRK